VEGCPQILLISFKPAGYFIIDSPGLTAGIVMMEV